MNVWDLFRLNGDVAIVTGGARTLGLQAAQALAEAGANVVVTSRSAESAERAAAQLAEANKVDALGVQLDVREEAGWDALIERVAERFGRIDVLVNNAGGRRVQVREQPVKLDLLEEFLEKRDLEEWQYTIDVNLTGVFLGCRAVAPIMRKQRKGKIINIASTDGMVGRDLDCYKDTGLSPTVADYLASKAGVINLTRGVACALARHNVNVNAISPAGFYRGQPEAFVENYCRLIPLGRMARDGIDLKGAILFCASEASAFMTGHNLVIDGGYTAW